MIIYEQGDIIKTDISHIIHGCNQQGVMGAGVAKTIRSEWPNCYLHYKNVLKSGDDGGPYGSSIYYTHGANPKVIGNLITQEFYGRSKAKYADPDRITKCLTWYIEETGAKIIASPKIGCNLGGLNWEEDVLHIYEEAAIKHEVDFRIYTL